MTNQILGKRQRLNVWSIRQLAARLISLGSGFIVLLAGVTTLYSTAASRSSAVFLLSLPVPVSVLGYGLFVSGILVIVGVLMLFLSNSGGSLVFLGGSIATLIGTISIILIGVIGGTPDIGGLTALAGGIIAAAVGSRRDLLQVGWAKLILTR